MTIAYWCLPIVIFLPLIWIGVAKTTSAGYDNSRPREWAETLTGRAQRARWAEQNSYEAFPPFAAAVIVAHLTGSDQSMVDALAVAFVVVRIAHGLSYIFDKSTARSLLWLTGYGVTIALFLI